MAERNFVKQLDEYTIKKGNTLPTYDTQIHRDTQSKFQFIVTVKPNKRTVISTTRDETIVKQNAAQLLLKILQGKYNTAQASMH